MKHSALIYAFVVFLFHWPFPIPSPLQAVPRKPRHKHPVTGELLFFENRARSAMASAPAKPKLDHLCTDFYEKVRCTLSKRYGKPLRTLKARCQRSRRS
jgi:hypothetical protein